MVKTKNIIGVLFLLMIIGYATISTSLSAQINTNISINPNDFKVYFSNVLVNSVQDLSLVKNEQELVFDFSFSNVGSINIINYDVTNASKNYDATLSINCTNGNEYLSVTNTFDTSNLSASSTRTGTLTLKKIKSNASGEIKTYTITCTITATPVERTSIGSGTIPEPIGNEYKIGSEITIDTEKFNIIREDGDYITLLAKYSLGTDYKQNKTTKNVTFSSSSGWEYTPGPKEIDIQNYDGNVKTYINEYVSYLRDLTGDSRITGTLITLMELKSLGCTINDDYSYTNDLTCANSEHNSWLVNGQYWWTRSADPNNSNYVWLVYDTGTLNNRSYITNCGVRPVITIPKSLI